MNKSKTVFHIGDEVKIINPLLFVRCGYPLTTDIVKSTLITKEQRDAIKKLMETFNIPITNLVYGIDDWAEPLEKIEHIMALAILKREKWGGRERKIFTECNPEFFNLCGRIDSKKVVNTGLYCCGRSSASYYGGYDDYDPPYLSNQKSHVILNVYISSYYKNIEIEQCNVVKVQKS